MEYIAIESKHIMEKSKKTSGFGCGYYLSPYIGCEYGCIYCDRYSDVDLPEYSEDKILVRMEASSILKKELKCAKKDVVCISGYQPAEKIYRVIRKSITVLTARNFPVHVITKSDIITEDQELLSKLSRNGWCTVTFVINTLDQKITEIFEPGSPSPKARMEALQKLVEAGITCGVTVMPVIPHISDSLKQLEELVDVVKEKGGKYVLHEPLVLENDIRGKVIKTIKKHFPETLIKYRRLYEIGASPDVLYQRRLRNRMTKIIRKSGLSLKLPYYSVESPKKQVIIEDYF